MREDQQRRRAERRAVAHPLPVAAVSTVIPLIPISDAAPSFERREVASTRQHGECHEKRETHTHERGGQLPE
jgi:hypothetical protein